jgi:tRNA G18 (ribose-2'-O)-methylase SpoU
MTPRLTVVAHNVRSLANVGTLFRTCDAAGVGELILSGYTGAPPDPRIDKVALGAVDAVPWRTASGSRELPELLAGRFVVVLEQHPQALRPSELVLPPDRDVALVACEELYGADAATLELADVLLELPMRGTKQSLNVAVAASIAMYAIADQMWGTADRDLASRQPHREVRPGVLTHGVTTGQRRGDPRQPA